MSEIKTAEDLIADANCGIVGIDEDLNVFEGYDGGCPEAHPSADCPEHRDPKHWRPLSKEEKRRLADIMIERWQRYKDAAE